MSLQTKSMSLCCKNGETDYSLTYLSPTRSAVLQSSEFPGHTDQTFWMESLKSLKLKSKSIEIKPPVLFSFNSKYTIDY